MGKETTKTVQQQLCTGVNDVEKEIDKKSIFNEELVKQATEELAKDKDAVKKNQIYDLLQQGSYNQNLILLGLRRRRAIDDAYATFLKKFAGLDKDGNIVSGVMADLYAGKLDNDTYKKRMKDLREEFNKVKKECDTRYAEYREKLRGSFPGWVYRWDLENDRD